MVQKFNSFFGAIYFANITQSVIWAAIVIALIAGFSFARTSTTRLIAIAWPLLIAAATASIFGNFIAATALLLIGTACAWWQIRNSDILLCSFDTTFSPPNYLHYFILCICIVVGAIFRFYDLEHITNAFEGELSPYYAASTSFQGIFIANKGNGGPWAPLGILFYLPIYVAIKIFGATLYAVRFSSAAVGLFTIILMYVVIRRMFNAQIALVAAALFSLNSMHIGWSRTDIHPHGVTTWPALIVALASYNFFKQKTWSYGLILAAAMALTWHQYPSGQSAVIVPWIIAIFQIVTFCLSKSGLASNKRSLALIAVVLLSGSLFWYLGLPVAYYFADATWTFPNPFTLTTQRTSWGNTADTVGIIDGALFVVVLAGQYFLDFLSGLIYQAPHLFHQDFVIEIPGLGLRTYPFLLLPSLLLGILWMWNLRSKLSIQIITALLIAAILPGILSERPYPKRMSVTFAVLDIISAIGIVCTARLAIAHRPNLKGWFSIQGCIVYILFASWLSYAWFSGRQFKIGEPAEVHAAQVIANEIRPDTLLTADIISDYDQGKLVFLLLDTMTSAANQPFKYDMYENSDRYHSASWVYLWTSLGDLPEEYRSKNDYKNHLWLFQHRKDDGELIPAKIENAIKECGNPKDTSVIELPADRTFFNPFTLVVCRK